MTENVFVQKLLPVSTLQPLALSVFPHRESDLFLPTVFWMTCIQRRWPNRAKLGGNKWCRSLGGLWGTANGNFAICWWGLRLVKKQRDPGWLIGDILQSRQGGTSILTHQPRGQIAVVIHAVYITLITYEWRPNPHFVGYCCLSKPQHTLWWTLGHGVYKRLRHFTACFFFTFADDELSVKTERG